MRIKLFILFSIVLGVFVYTQTMLRIGSGTPPAMAPIAEQADLVQVIKSARTLNLFRDDKIIRSYRISLGATPQGHKVQEGDERTPEGNYVLDWRNANSIAHLSLHVSYPNKTDQEEADARNVLPGGNIMIHGILNGWGFLGRLHQIWDWTNGCIAVTNGEMREIWSLVPDGTPISIMWKD